MVGIIVHHRAVNYVVHAAFVNIMSVLQPLWEGQEWLLLLEIGLELLSYCCLQLISITG